MNNRTTLDKMKEATLKALNENRLDNDDLVDFCNFVLTICNAESITDAAKRLGVSKQAVSKSKDIKVIAGKKFHIDNY